MNKFAVKDEKGKLLVEFDATPETAAAIIFLLEEAAKAQTEKVATWMIEQGFTTGHGDSLEDLLRELARQIKAMKDQYEYDARRE
jgi:hypothetical protein